MPERMTPAEEIRRLDARLERITRAVPEVREWLAVHQYHMQGNFPCEALTRLLAAIDGEPAEKPPAQTNSATHFQHYFSTYCIHGLHEQCRKTCKTCGAACLCECHGRTGEPGEGR